MNKFIGFIFSLLFICQLIVNAQPQWKYHIAFEDATGAKDTVWFIWDESATYEGNDIALGEVPVSLNLEEFNVYMHNPGLTYIDTFKVAAIPYYYGFDHQVRAFNFQLPISISWDTSLLHAGFLPPEPVGWVNFARLYNDYFFMINNLPPTHEFDMTQTNKVQAPDPANTDPWFWQLWVHFPMDVFLDQNPYTVIEESKEKLDLITISPNPVNSKLNVKSIEDIYSIIVYNSSGQQLLELYPQSKATQVDVSTFKPGIYYLNLINNQHKIHYKKFIKTNY